jgi:hypothetical protein
MLEQKARPPFARFEVRAIEDRDASIEAGQPRFKDVIYALVTPTGSRDIVEKPADEWIAGLREGVNQNRIPAEWPEAYQRALDAFKAGREDPTEGFAIKDWSSATPAQIKIMLDIGVRTVEDLAAANEETLSRIGMGANALKQKAINWLQNSVDGQASERATALEIENKQLKEGIEELRVRLEKIEQSQKEEA